MEFRDRHKMITDYYDALTRSLCEQHALTRMEYDTLMFLFANPEVRTAAEIVRLRRSTKSHVSIALAALEEMGFIARRRCSTNKKRIDLFVSEEGAEIAREGVALQQRLMADLFSGLSDEEMEVYRRVFKKICNNAEAHLKDEA